MVSLADIAFLIIFFFLLTSTFMRDRLVVALPKLPRTKQTETPISVAMDKGAKLFLNGQEMPSAESLGMELKALLVDKKTPKDCEVRFRCDKDLKYKDYQKVYQAIGDAGGIIAIVHETRTP